MNDKYTLTIPLINELSTPSTRETYYGELSRAGAQRVLLCPPRLLGSADERPAVLELLAENLRFYAARGLEVGVWLDGLGHGAPLIGPETYLAGRYTPICSLDGDESRDSYCPLDPGFAQAYCAMIRDVAALRPALILIDDDFRLSLRSGHDVGCACTRHLDAYAQRLGKRITRDILAQHIFSGGPNRYRDIWLDLMGDTLRDFARLLRQTVDTVDPSIRLGHCACITTWDTDGVDSLELAQIFAGSTRPLLRLIGAPYWAATRSFGMRSPAEPAELERLQLHWWRQKGEDCEVFSECDSFPRPRNVVPAAYLEGFESILRADGLAQGCLKYMLDYHGSPLYETGYVDRHVKYRRRNDELAQLFDGKTSVGLQLYEPLHKLRGAWFEGNGLDRVVDGFFPAAQRLALGCSMPVSYEEDPHTATLVFGESARYTTDSDFAGRPMVLDAASAQILLQRGWDIGLETCSPCDAPLWEHFPSQGERLPVDGAPGFYHLRIKPGAEVLSWFETEQTRRPAVYRYSSDTGGRVLVFAFDAAQMKKGVNGLFSSYCRQRQLKEALTWLQGRPPAAFCEKNPGLYLLAKQGGARLAVALWNFSEDEVLAPQVMLGRTYTHLRLPPFCRASASLCEAKVVFDSDLAPFSCTAFEVW